MAGTWALVGRRRELERFRDVLAAGERSAVVLAGPEGVGKTRLAAECLGIAEGRGMATARVKASHTARSLPLGALAPLLPPHGGPGLEPADMLRRAMDAIAALGGGKKLVLLVDDAHLLDDTSATLVYQLAATRSVFVLATVRQETTAPDAVVALWKDDLAERVEVSPLAPGHVEAVLTAALGGPVSAATLHELTERSAGNTLYLRELVLAGRESGALAEEDGIWRLSRSVVLSSRLVELVEGRLSGVADPARKVIEALAFGEPLGVPCLLMVIDRPGLESLENRGLVAVAYNGRRLEVCLAHPLYGEVLRDRIPAMRAQAVLAALADRVQSVGARRREDALRFATWRLATGGDMAPDVMMSAAVTARARWDLGLAARLAEAAVRAGGGFDAALLEAEVALLRGRGEDAEQTLSALLPLAADDRQRVRVVSARVDNLVRSLGHTAAALQVLREAEAVVTDPAGRDELAVKRGFALHMGGRLAEALEVLDPLIARADGPAFGFACYTAAACLVRAGRLREAVAVLDRGAAVVDLMPGEEQSLARWLTAVRCAALLAAGAIADAERLATANHTEAVARGSVGVHAVFSQILARIHLAVGDVTAAARSARESRTLFRERRYLNPARTALTYLAQAEALAGSADGARAALAELEEMGLPTEALNAVELRRARGWAQVAGGNLAGARAHLVESATLARHQGDLVWESDALHDLARLGWAAEAEPRLHDLAVLVEGDMAPARARHATALVAHDAEALDQVAAAFEAMGALLLAAEAAAASAVVLRRQGDVRRAAGLELRAAELARGCHGAVTPPLRAIQTQALLSAREIEVAALAAAGLANKEIAGRLNVSVRTVENHLQRVYEKLGVARRADLAQALTPV
ncbi:MAG TPA: LuxR C-terminal-related transcriptional regulator [Acidimicrobiales bacterium]|nr:LuxR C-terminal-related transcriptional regulator [Acidimicrobiales bacterium]